MELTGVQTAKRFGIELSYVDKLKEWHMVGEGNMEGAPYCFMTSSAVRDHYDVDLTVPNMEAFITGVPENFLTHGLMRMIKKAKVSVMEPALWVTEFFGKTTSIDDKVRIISNGREAIVTRE